MSIPSSLFSSPPDPTTRQPFAAAFLPLYACHYVLSVLAILPHTYILKLAFPYPMAGLELRSRVGFLCGVGKVVGA
jgi:hypothetical protein